MRITLDEQLSFCLPHLLGTAGMPVGPRPGDIIASGPARILEIKLWGRMPAWLDDAVAGLHPAPTFSKFRMGMLALGQRFGSPPITDGDSPMSTLFALSPEIAQ